MRKAMAMLLAVGMAASMSACSSSGSASGTTAAAETTAAVTETTGAGAAANSSTAVSSETDWPTGTITLLCGYSAGGSSDLNCRYMATALEKQLGQNVIVENVPGSGSWLAWNRLLQNTEKDGNTFALINLSALYGHYDETNPREATIDDFELLTNQVIDPQVICIRTDESRFTDYKSMVEYAKTNPLVVAAATSGITSGDASVAKYLEKQYGCQMNVIPVDGASDAETMFLAGETDILLGNVGDVMDAEANGYKPIVIYAEERSEFLPDCPTEKETGAGGAYVSFSARGYAYPKGVDEAIVNKMIEAQKAAAEDPEYLDSMKALGCDVEVYAGEDYYNLLQDQLDQRLEIWGVQK